MVTPPVKQGGEVSIYVRVHSSAGKAVFTRKGRQVQPEHSLDALNAGAKKGKNA